MKKLHYLLVIIPMSVLTFSCSNTESGSTTTTDSTTTMNEKMKETGNDIKDAANNAATEVKEAVSGNTDSNFVVKATVANQNEIIMLQEGMKLGTSKDLKAHAKMMLADHTKLQTKMEAYAKAKNYPVMDKEKAAKELSKISDKAGNDWDKAWANRMVDDHKNCIDLFEKASGNVKDAELKAMVDNTLPTLKSHLDMVTTFRDNLK